MAIALEKRFDALVNDVHAIQKELILLKMQHIKKNCRNLDIWNALSQIAECQTRPQALP